jgi:hypothetical protein
MNTVHIYGNILLTAGKSFRECQNTHFLLSKVFPKKRASYEILSKNEV